MPVILFEFHFVLFLLLSRSLLIMFYSLLILLIIAKAENQKNFAVCPLCGKKKVF